MTQQIKSWASKSNYGEDMDFLNTVIWPQVENDQISHDPYHCEKYPGVYPFPTKRSAIFQHVGQVFDEMEQSDSDHIQALRDREAPEACRKHKSWKYG